MWQPGTEWYVVEQKLLIMLLNKCYSLFTTTTYSLMLDIY